MICAGGVSLAGAGEDALEPRRDRAIRSLHRLVGFVAAAFDARYAFVAALEDPCHLTLWVARCYGLASEQVRLRSAAVMGEGTGLPDYLGALRQIWPGERALSLPSLRVETRAPLVGRDGVLRGHLGLLETEPVAGASHHERLGPLARVAAAEVEAWSRPSLS